MIKQKIQEIFATEELIDKYFPKGDKRRGEVLALISVLNAKVQKEIDKLKENIISEVDKLDDVKEFRKDTNLWIQYREVLYVIENEIGDLE